jgi:ATP-binding cassette subfamily G (WHITE) protein 2 (PDR)
MPNFVVQRSLYEARERPSKTYSWKVFILSNIVAEIPWSRTCTSSVSMDFSDLTYSIVLSGTIIFVSWYYPIGYYENAIPTHSVHIRGALMWMYIELFLLFTSTFATMIVAGMETAETAGNLGNLFFSLCLVFCGYVLASFQSRRHS